MAFDILSLQRNRGAQGQQGQQDKTQTRAQEEEQRAKLLYLDVFSVVPSEDNFYSMSAIEELAALIELAGGVKEPGIVVQMDDGRYKAVSGNRRRLASIRLVERGEDQYRLMPFMLEPQKQEETKSPEEAAEAAELRKIDEEILLIAANGQREKTDWDKVEEATRMKRLLERKRKFQKVPGKTREIIARQLKTTPAQIGRYESIEKHLMPEFKEAMKNEQVIISVAYELSTLPENVQNKAFSEFKEKGALAIEDVKRLKQEEEEKRPCPGQMYFDGNEITEPGEPEQEEREKEDKKETEVHGTEAEAEEQHAEAAPPSPTAKIAPAPVSTVADEPETMKNEKEPQETRCIDSGICPYCLEKFNAEEAVNYSTQGTQCSDPVPCPHCGKLINIFCSVEYFCSAPEE